MEKNNAFIYSRDSLKLFTGADKWGRKFAPYQVLLVPISYIFVDPSVVLKASFAQAHYPLEKNGVMLTYEGFFTEFLMDHDFDDGILSEQTGLFTDEFQNWALQNFAEMLSEDYLAGLSSYVSDFFNDNQELENDWRDYLETQVKYLDLKSRLIGTAANFRAKQNEPALLIGAVLDFTSSVPLNVFLSDGYHLTDALQKVYEEVFDS